MGKLLEKIHRMVTWEILGWVSAKSHKGICRGVSTAIFEKCNIGGIFKRIIMVGLLPLIFSANKPTHNTRSLWSTPVSVNLRESFWWTPGWNFWRKSWNIIVKNLWGVSLKISARFMNYSLKWFLEEYRVVLLEISSRNLWRNS